MKISSFFFFACWLLVSGLAYAQAPSATLLSRGDSLYKARAYAQSVKVYETAFKNSKPSGFAYYNAACSAALAGDKKKAFKFLDLAIENSWSNVNHFKSDSDLKSLHPDKRWPKTVAKLEEKVAKLEANYDKPLQAELLQIFEDDQSIRHIYLKARDEVGYKHPKVDSLGRVMHRLDSLNQLKVIAILEKHGWVGSDKVGGQASQALFLVIQHADRAIQEKYLPLMREAVKKGKADAGSLALLEDRVALAQGKKQIYGSQIGWDEKTNSHFVLPLEDPLNVDARRAQMGLGTLAEYVKHWKITWNAETYQKEQAKK